MTPDQLLSRVLYRDGMMLIVDKPAGLPVHPGPGGGPNLEMLFDALRFGLPRPPSLAHRLDRDTAGCLALGRHRKALARLGKLFMQGKIEKTYWAVVQGAPPAPEGRVDAPLAKLTPKRGWKMIVSAEGQSAITDYRTLGSSDGMSWLELRPRTGRTHQIRVHCAHLGCPLLGDAVYGVGANGDGRPLHLLARALTIPLYPNKDPVSAEAPPPEHMRAALRACGWSG